MLSGTQPDVTSCLRGPISFAAALRQANHASPQLRNPAERPFDLISILLPCHGLQLRRSGLFGNRVISLRSGLFTEITEVRLRSQKA